MAIKDWIPRSRWFYIVSGTAASTGYYIWWDRHQSDLAQRLYEHEVYSRFGQQPLSSTEEPIKVTVLLAAEDNFELLERRRLFRKHVARLFLKAGIDWQVVEVNEAVLARRLNEARLADDSHKPVERVPREPLITSLATSWSLNNNNSNNSNNNNKIDMSDDDEDVRELKKSYAIAPSMRSFLRGDLVALDKRSFDSLENGVKAAASINERQRTQRETEKRSWWPFSHKSPSSSRDHMTPARVHQVDLPIHHSTWRRFTCFLNKRQQTIQLCQEAIDVINKIYYPQLRQ